MREPLATVAIVYFTWGKYCFSGEDRRVFSFIFLHHGISPDIPQGPRRRCRCPPASPGTGPLRSKPGIFFKKPRVFPNFKF